MRTTIYNLLTGKCASVRPRGVEQPIPDSLTAAHRCTLNLPSSLPGHKWVKTHTLGGPGRPQYCAKSCGNLVAENMETYLPSMPQ